MRLLFCLFRVVFCRNQSYAVVLHALSIYDEVYDTDRITETCSAHIEYLLAGWWTREKNLLVSLRVRPHLVELLYLTNTEINIYAVLDEIISN